MDWPLLAELSETERQELTSLSRPRTYARNEVICHEGDLADSMHLVAEGHLSVRVSMESGDAAMINVLGPGDYWGELALLREDRRRTATITALEPASTLVIAGSAFRRLAEGRPGIQRALAVALADRVDRLSHQVLDLMFIGLDRRVYRSLVGLARMYPPEEDGSVTVPLTQAQLAELTGGTRPSVNQALQRLVDEGIARLGRGRVEVLDPEALARRAGAP